MNVSIVVPVYNVREYLPDCVLSVQGQTVSDFECILVDDGSTDGSGDVCDDIVARDPRFRVIHKTNGGLSDARNAGIAAAKGRYLAFVDADDVIEPTMIEVLQRKIECDNVDVAVGKVRLYDITSGERREYAPLSTPEPRGILDELWNTTVCNKMYRREVFSSRRFVKGIKFEDMPMWADILFSGCSIGYTDSFVYQYNINRPKSIVSTGDYRGYPFAWDYQRRGLVENGYYTPQVASDFVARITMKFIQAYNRSSGNTRAEFYRRTQEFLQRCGPVGLSSEHNQVISAGIWLHTLACRLLPAWLYGIVFGFERVLLLPRINKFLKTRLQ